MDNLRDKLRSNLRISESRQRHKNDSRASRPTVRIQQQTGSLCSLCEQAVHLRPPPGKTQEDVYELRGRSFREIQQAAGIGCTICTEIYEFILNPLPLINPLDDTLLRLSPEKRNRLHIGYALLWDGFTYNELQIEFFDSEAKRECYGYQMYQLLPIDAVQRFDAPGPRLEGNGRCSCCLSSFERIISGFEDYMSIINFWMDTCLEGHSKCDTDKFRFLPNRVIDVGIEDVTSEPRLVTRRDPAWKAGEPYITLSHRWKTNNMPTLLTNNIAAFKSAIPMKSLPRTFREAIHVTRKLGVKFLWIDALTIIQDSEDDWKHESTLMGKIYESGYLNISALEADQETGALFHSIRTADPYDNLNLRVKSDWNLPFNQGSNECYLVRQSLFYGISGAPLNRRGWVFQERALAPRTIYFGRERIFWECCQGAASSFRSASSVYNLSWPQNFEESYGTFRRNPKKWRSLLKKNYEAYKTGECSLNQAYLHWNTNALNYARTELSKDSDKLVALSGLAKSFKDVIEDQYLAGLWRRTLVYDLLWRAIDNRSTSRPLEYRSPSWSWANLDFAPHGINMQEAPEYSFESHQVADIINVHVESVDEDTTGQVKTAFLKVRGILLPFPKKVQGNTRSRSRITENQNLVPHDMSNPVFSQFQVYYDLLEEAEELDQHLYLHLIVWTVTDTYPGDGSQSTIRGLTLRPVYPGSDEFIRIGSFDADVENLPQYHNFFEKVARSEENLYRVVKIV